MGGPFQASVPESGPGVSDRCGQPFGGIRPDDVTYLLASALDDTVRDDFDGRPVGFGQLADLNRVSGAQADRVDAATGGAGSVVLVPWGFDEGCQPIVWTGSWRWAHTDVEGFYRGRLRSPEYWIDGYPTFDVHAAVWEGFPASPWKHPLSDGRLLLSAAEMYELYDRLPTAEAIGARPYGSVSGLVTWRREAGDLAERYPARTVVAEAFELAELARLRSAALPFAGTYRVDVRTAAETVSSFLLRTGPVGSEPLRPAADVSDALPAAPLPAPAFQAATALATTEADLETTTCVSERGLRASAHETSAGAGEGALHAWAADVSVHIVTACFGDAEILRRLRAPAATDEFAGAFRQEVDGRFTLRQTVRLEDDTSLELVGERISLATLPAPPAVRLD